MFYTFVCPSFNSNESIRMPFDLIGSDDLSKYLGGFLVPVDSRRQYRTVKASVPILTDINTQNVSELFVDV
jgi:hypothetical protein